MNFDTNINLMIITINHKIIKNNSNYSGLNFDTPCFLR